MSVLKGDGLFLRPIVRSDLEYLNNWKNKEEIYKYLGGGYLPVSIDIQEQWLGSLMDTTGNCKRFIIETNESRVIGMIGLYDISWIHRTCELGIMIGDTSAQGNGYGPQAYRLLASYAQRYLGLRKIKAYVVKDNLAAVKMYEKLDFRQVGELIDERYIDGTFHSLLIMEKFL